LHLYRVQAMRFWESSPTLAPEDGSLAAAVGEWIDEMLLGSPEMHARA
jgi:hypothetical protein